MKKTGWMAVMAALVVIIAAPVQAQVNEFSFGTFVSESGNSGYGRPIVGGTVHGQAALGMWDVGGGFSYSTFPKLGTPGGHHTTKSVFVRRWFGPNVFASADSAWVHGDATVWTKDATFVGGTAGVRLRGPQRYKTHEVVTRDGRPFVAKPIPGRHEDIVFVAYDQEIKTDAVAPNRSRIWTLGWNHYFPVGGSAYLKSGLSFSYSRFLQGGDWWSSPSVAGTVSLAFRASE